MHLECHPAPPYSLGDRLESRLHRLQRLTVAADGAVHFALVFAGFDGLALVANGLAAGEGDGHLGEASRVEKDAQRNERQTLLLNLGLELPQFGFVNEKFAFSNGVVVLSVGKSIGQDMRSDEPEFAVDKADVGLLDRHVLVAKAFDFGPDQGDAAFEFFEGFEAKTRFSVRADRLVHGCF